MEKKKNPKKWRAAALVLALALLCGLCGCGASGSGELRFGTGGVGGTYYSFGSSLSQMLSEDEESEISLAVKTTAGSAANLRLLSEGFLDVALVQSDVLSDAVKGTGLFVTNGPGSGYAAVAGLYTEACQIIVAAESDIETVYDLSGKRVSLGERESGALQNAEAILMAHGLTPEMLSAEYLSYADSASALEKGEIDAFFCTAGAPTSVISDLAAKKSIRLLSISQDVIRSILRMYNGYSRCEIPANTYPGQDSEVSTVGVKAVLVASTDVREKDVNYLIRFLFENSDRLSAAVGAAVSGLDIEYATSDIPSSFHPGAVGYYSEQGKEVEVYSGSGGKTVSGGQD